MLGKTELHFQTMQRQQFKICSTDPVRTEKLNIQWNDF
jgi:hypothetical protein